MSNDAELLAEAGVPRILIEKSFCAQSGELAWKPDDILDVLKAVGEAGVQILGGELWYVDELGRIHGAVPLRGSLATGVFSWSTSGRYRHEPWVEFCKHAAVDSAGRVQALAPERFVSASFVDGLHWNVTFGHRAVDC